MATVQKMTKKRKAVARKKSAANNVEPQKLEAVVSPKVVGMSSAWRIFRGTLSLLWSRRKFTAIFIAVLAALNLVLISTSIQDAAGLKSLVAQHLDNDGTLATSIATYGILLSGTITSTDAASSVYQYILFIIGSLAIIWSLRHMTADKDVQVKVSSSFYDGMYPLVPFVLVLMVLVLTLIPLAIGSALYNVITSGNLATSLVEQAISMGVFLSALTLSLWLLAMFLPALYIVTLPEMRPFQALKNAKTITKGHRLSIMRKILFLTIVMMLAVTIIVLPLLMVVPFIAQWLLFLLGIAALVVGHTYLYLMYRELIP